ncbi:venom dipeptidyl peptidase 4-like [Scaptodrosophila lebanonensis]|uniref:Venom dipeptidyl peptidase 4 n=1 Tax=Drosophila lebanonensis TaxID=7225 RepID=A0A6J2TRR1_DROLE|nr:venom dipeptidyl peptidase 4-like [Scaptodrosophila lebanonensis]
MAFQLLALVSIIFGPIGFTEASNEPSKTPWELEEITTADQLKYSLFITGKWLTAEKFYYATNSSDLELYNVRTQKTKVLLSREELGKYYKSEPIIDLSADEKELFISSSYPSNYTLLNIEGASAKVLYSNITSYSQENRLIFTSNRTLCLRLENVNLKCLTPPESTEFVNHIPSPDGTKVAVTIQDESRVKFHKLLLYGDIDGFSNQYVKEKDIKYAKIGAEKGTQYLQIYDLRNPALEQVSVKAPEDIVGPDSYLDRYLWLNHTHLLVIWLNRRQNVSTFQVCATSGVCQEVKRLQELNGWVEGVNSYDHGTNIEVVNSGRNCIFLYWIDDWYQIWNMDLETGKNIWQSRGNFTVLKIYGYDEKNDKIYYQATRPNDPAVAHIFSNDECLTCELRDEEGTVCEHADASFNDDFSLFAAFCRGPSVPYSIILETNARRVLRVIEKFSDIRLQVANKLQPISKYMNVTLADGSSGYAKLQLPPNFSETKKYPLLVYVYGGPHTTVVSKQFKIEFQHYMTTKHNVIWAYIDGRGTPNKGRSLQFSVNNHLGDFEVQDQLHVTHWFQENLPYVDSKRTGIWGHSYGGYMVIKILQADDKGVFQCGAAGAPVTTWTLYKNWYGERYMGLLDTVEQLRDFNRSSTLNDIENLRSHQLLLMHGTADDNVPIEHTHVLAKKLQDANILFDEMIFVDADHHFSYIYSFKLMERFFTRCLKLSEL